MKNLSLESSVQEIIKRLNNSIDDNNTLRNDIIELSESIEELNYIEVEDFIDTIKNIDDKVIRKQIEGEICPTARRTKKVVTKRTTTRKAKLGRPLGSRNSYQRVRGPNKEKGELMRKRSKYKKNQKKNKSKRN